jgi:hypothetical protein
MVARRQPARQIAVAQQPCISRRNRVETAPPIGRAESMSARDATDATTPRETARRSEPKAAQGPPKCEKPCPGGKPRRAFS